MTTSPKDSPSNNTEPGQLPPHLQKAVAKVTEISSLPEITARIVEVVEDPRATAHDMHEIVKNDPALASKILKVVNSAFYGLPAQIASLDRAIVMLGLSAVKNIALAASLVRLFKPGTISENFSARDLWRHCIAVGVCGRMLTKAASGVQNDEAFVAGLVHDLGLLIEYQVLSERLTEVVNRCQATGEDFSTVEHEIIGADHQAFGAALAAKWKFPPILRCAISHHHTPETLKPELQRVAALVCVSDTICCKQQHGFWLTAACQEVKPEMLALIGVSDSAPEEILEDLPGQIREAEQVFGD
ncbi:MAG: HDOD domain-containing protein [Phycisphaerae bacterium]|nr:HDOD domain-containing protein [Phycisphaerae bacterium]